MTSLDVLHEVTITRLFNAIVSCLVSELLLADDEIDLLIEELNEIKEMDYKMHSRNSIVQLLKRMPYAIS